MTGFEIHRTLSPINKINHLGMQIAANPSRKYANSQPAATRNPTRGRLLSTRLALYNRREPVQCHELSCYVTRGSTTLRPSPLASPFDRQRIEPPEEESRIAVAMSSFKGDL